VVGTGRVTVLRDDGRGMILRLALTNVDQGSGTFSVTLDGACHALDLQTDRDFPEPAGCGAENFLSRDSFDVLAFALRQCLDRAPDADCVRGADDGGETLTLPGLDEGVGTVLFRFHRAAGRSSRLLGFGAPDVTPAPAGIDFEATGLPEEIDFETALRKFYFTPELEDGPFVCAWR
jgi:hypothetical protein